MKVCSKLLFTTASIAVLAFAETATATDFTLSGKFGSYFNSPYANGSFDGTYSYEPNAIPNITSYSVNLRDASGKILGNFTGPFASELGILGSIQDNGNNSVLFFFTGPSILTLYFPKGFSGIGNVIPFNSSLYRSFSSFNTSELDVLGFAGVSGSADVISGTSNIVGGLPVTNVPEPEDGVVLSLLVLSASFFIKKINSIFKIAGIELTK